MGSQTKKLEGEVLSSLDIRPVPMAIAKMLFVRNHYLRSLPGGTCLNIGIFAGDRLLGAVALGAGPPNSHSLVEGAVWGDCLALTRLWLSDELPHNSESRTLGLVIRAIRKHTSVKFLLTYADPSQDHVGTIYQATNWLYTGLSAAMPLYDLGDGVARHSRTIAHSYGSHSVRYFADHGVDVRLVPQESKHRYVYFVDPRWRGRLRVPVLPYPVKGGPDEGR